MTMSRVIMAITFACLIGAGVLTSEASTTFTHSTILGIDQAKRTITFKTKEGQSWTLSVADPNLLDKDQVSKGDHVSIEIDLDSRITKIVQLTEGDRAEPPPPQQ